MRRVFQSALLLAMAAAGTMTVLAAQRPTFVTNQQATLVMKNGERHSGTLVYHNDANFNLIVNGQEQPYPIDDVAVLTIGGDPTPQELNQLPTSGNPPELQRHMLVLRDGTVVHGKLYTIKQSALTFDTQEGNRRDFDLSNVGRLYISAPAARQVFSAQLAQPQAPPQPATVSGTSGRNNGAIRGAIQGAIQVDAARGWTDTGINVTRGQRLSFQTTGEVHWGLNADQTANADGKPDPSQRTLPVPGMGVGGLIGRVGNGRPFPIGSNSQPITMPAAGRLYLGVNDITLGDNSGIFTVSIGG